MIFFSMKREVKKINANANGGQLILLFLNTLQFLFEQRELTENPAALAAKGIDSGVLESAC